ncbi:hypothetical protein KY284_017803 [Solanum tuberosum]|nr:hypothetical protein KY284_017803 [Solanum tuberosum]
MADIISNVFNENDEFRALILSDKECAEELQYQEVLAASLEIFHLHMSSTQIEESPESSQVTCPGLKCCATIEPVSCKSIIPENVFEKWEGGLSESALLDCEKFYCPYKDCSELLIYDHDQDIIECVCPVCHRQLCAACGVPWHTGLDCDKFQNDEKNREDDLKVEELASSSKWMKCPHCKHIVQKADGVDLNFAIYVEKHGAKAIGVVKLVNDTGLLLKNWED